MSVKSYELKDICEIRSGKRLPKGTDFSECITDYKYIRARDIKNGKINGSELVYISEDIHKKLSRYIVNTDDIVITIVGASVGDVAYVTNEFEGVNLTENAVRLTQFDECVNSKYLMYILNSRKYWELMQHIAGGAAQPKLGIYKIQSIVVELPERKTQDKVVNILSAYDDLIENNQKQIKLLEEAAQRLYEEWFVDFRFPGHENTPIIDGVPQGWSIVCLDDVICKIATGLNPRKNFVLGQGTNYYVTIKNMSNNNVFLDEKCDFVDNAAIERINQRSDLKIGDLLFSGIGTIGRVYLIDIPTNNWNISESVFTMRANDRVSKEFLYLLLLSKDMQSYCDNNAHGAAQKGIRMADLRAYKFMLPCKYHLDEFTSKIKPIIDASQVCRKKVKILTEARDRLLPKLMSGELEV